MPGKKRWLFTAIPAPAWQLAAGRPGLPRPDVFFVACLVDRSQADELQARTKIPLVALSYGQLATFDKDVYQSLQLIGRITGNEKRAVEVVEFLQDCQQEGRQP